MMSDADLLGLAADLAEAAGRLLLGHFPAGGPSRAVTESIASKSTITDLVTAADRASEQLIVGRLASERPDDGILAEEGSESRSRSGLTWVIDPLDGTINFVYGLPVFGVSIACRDDEGSRVAVVQDPLRSETFTAVRGGGAARNGVPLRLGPGPRLGEALIGTGFSYGAGRRGEQAALLANVISQVRDIRRGGAAALDLCWVAAGRLDGHYEAGLAPWDRAAGSLVATEAGASVEDVGSLLPGEPALSTLVAAAPGLGAPLRALLERAAGRD
jgi:myo-inositol-1(or 4)-monophosphatase